MASSGCKADTQVPPPSFGLPYNEAYLYVMHIVVSRNNSGKSAIEKDKISSTASRRGMVSVRVATTLRSVGRNVESRIPQVSDRPYAARQTGCLSCRTPTHKHSTPDGVNVPSIPNSSLFQQWNFIWTLNLCLSNASKS